MDPSREVGGLRSGGWGHSEDMISLLDSGAGVQDLLALVAAKNSGRRKTRVFCSPLRSISRP
jgi:hypothetical protein